MEDSFSCPCDPNGIHKFVQFIPDNSILSDLNDIVSTSNSFSIEDAIGTAIVSLSEKSIFCTNCGASHSL